MGQQRLKVETGIGDTVLNSARLEADSEGSTATDISSCIQAALWQTSSSSALNALRHLIPQLLAAPLRPPTPQKKKKCIFTFQAAAEAKPANQPKTKVP